MDTIDLRSIGTDSTLGEAVACSFGFVSAGHAEQPSRPNKTFTYPSMPAQEWVEICNTRNLPIAKPGCLFARDITIYGPGQALMGQSLITEDVELSKVATQWHEGTASSLDQRNVVSIKEPVISFITPGHRIWGHWLTDILPRLMVARKILEDHFDAYELLLPSNTPPYGKELCSIIFDDRMKFREYDYDHDILKCNQVCIPTSPVSDEHDFHSWVRELYEPHRGKSTGHRKLCISRSRVEGKTAGVVKHFPQREIFERTAADHKYEMIYPENMPIVDQIALFGEARVIVGEYGSALHNSIFAPELTIIGAAGNFNTFQQRLCAMSNQINAFVIPEKQELIEGAMHYECTPQSISDFFEAIDKALSDEKL